MSHYDLVLRKREQINVHGVWVVDFVTPSTLAGSVKNMKRVAWRDVAVRKEGPEQWMESTRSINAGGWKNLGYVSHNKNELMPYITRVSGFPKRYSYANFRLITVTPSLSAIFAFFRFSEDAEKSIEKIARQHLFPKGEPHLDGAISIYDPRRLKERNLKSERKVWRDEIGSFLARNFATYFSTQSRGLLTTVELIETSNLSRETLRFVLDDYDLWETETAKLAWSSSHNAPGGHSIASVRTEDLKGAKFGEGNEPKIDDLLHELEYSIPATWTFEALHNLMRSFESSISRFRDEEFRPLVSYSGSSAMLRNERAREMADIALIANEIEQSRFHWLLGEMQDFERASPPDERISLKSVLLENLKSRSSEVLKHHANVTAVRKAMNEASTAFEMAKIARLSFRATLVSIVIAFGAFLVAADVFQASSFSDLVAFFGRF